MTVTANTQKITDDQITEYQPLVKSIAYKFKKSGVPYNTSFGDGGNFLQIH